MEATAAFLLDCAEKARGRLRAEQKPSVAPGRHRTRGTLVPLLALAMFPLLAHLTEAQVSPDELAGLADATRVYLGSAGGRAFAFDPNNEESPTRYLETSLPVFKVFGLANDGRRLLYSPLRGAVPSGELWVEDLTNQSLTKIPEFLVLEAAWDPTEPSRVALTYSGGDHFGLAILDLESGQVLARTLDSVFADRLVWEASGRGVFYLALTDETDRAHGSVVSEPFGIPPSFTQEYLPLAAESQADLERAMAVASTPDFPSPTSHEDEWGYAFGGVDVRTPAFRVRTRSGRNEAFGENILGPGPLHIRSTASDVWTAIGEAQLLATLEGGLVLRRFDADGSSHLSFLSWDGNERELADGAAPFGGDVDYGPLLSETDDLGLPLATGYNLPLSSLWVTQGGASYAAPGNCNTSGSTHSATSSMAYAYDMQRQVVGEPVMASAVGTVVGVKADVTCNSADTSSCSAYVPACSNSNGGWGNVVILQHADGTWTKYAHLQEYSLRVALGGVACQGFWLGNQGHTGATVGNFNGCGDHLHFQRQSSSAFSGTSIAVTFDDVVSNPLNCTTYNSGSTLVSSCATTCTSFSLSPTSVNAGSSSGSFSVGIIGSPSGCTGGSWSTSGYSSWVSVSPSSGSGSGSATVSWTANSGPARTGYPSVAGNTFTVNQASGQTTCSSLSISPTSFNASSSSGSTSVNVIGSPSGCTGGSWSTSGYSSWVSVSPSSGSGSGSATVSWTANSGSARTGYPSIAGNTFTVNQASGQTTCSSLSISPTSFNAGSSGGSTSVNVVGVPSGCTGGSWSTSGFSSWVSVSPSSGSGSGAATVSWTTNSGSARTGLPTIANNTFTVNQAAGGGSVQLSNGVSYPDNLSAGTVQEVWKYYYIDVPAGATTLTVVLDTLTADVDLYVNPGVQPDAVTYVCRPFLGGTDSETCSLTNPAAGTWWIGVNNWDTGSISYRVTATYTVSTPTIQITSPSGGETWTGGMGHTVTWTASALDASGSLQLYYWDGTWQFVTSLSPFATSYNWNVPDISLTDAQIWVGNAVAGVWETYDTSDFSIAAQSTDTSSFYTVAPCRVIDTRWPSGQLGGGPVLVAGASRLFQVGGQCGIPVGAAAVSVNIAVTGSTAAGNLRLYAGGAAVPDVSAINYSGGQTRSNNAVVPLNGLGELDTYVGQASGTVHLILDVNGYFQ